jgi:hypothetical protein
VKKTAFLIAIFLSLAFFLSFINPAPLVAKQAGIAKTAAAANCLEYGPKVQLIGRLVKKTFPGPPNYASVARGDTPEVVWILHLDKSICVKARPGNDFDVAVSQLQDLQLALGNINYYQHAKELLSRKVIVTGVLFGAHTGHHHTPVLLDVENIQSMVDKY